MIAISAGWGAGAAPAVRELRGAMVRGWNWMPKSLFNDLGGGAVLALCSGP